MEEVGPPSSVILHPSTQKLDTIKRWEPPEESCSYDIKGTQLFDLFSITISLIDFFDEEPLPRCVDVYGHILLIDDQGNEFVLFYRDRENSERLPLFYRDRENSERLPVTRKSTFPTITLHKFHLESPRCFPGCFCLVFYLKEKSQDTVVAELVRLMHGDVTGVTDIAYDQRYLFQIHRSCDVGFYSSYASVDYTIFQSALLACVGFVIEKTVEDVNDDSDDVYAEMSGVISASFKVKDGSNFEHVLHNSHSCHKFGDYVKLSIFGVPVYSLLNIQVDININGIEFCTSSSSLIFDPCDTFFDVPYEKDMVAHNLRIRMLVKWGHASCYLPECQLREWRDPSRKEIIEDLNWEDENENSIKINRLIWKCKKRLRCMNKKKFQPIIIHPRFESLTNRDWIISSFPQMLVEVFSISTSLYGYDSPSISLSGKIIVRDGNKKLFLFMKNKRKPQPLTLSGHVPLKSHDTCYYGSRFDLLLNLIDSQGNEIGNGFVAYDFCTVRNWLDKRLTSIVKGKDGFATVHHTIFSDALQAKIKFAVFSDFDDKLNCQAYGKIKGRYGSFRYSTDYEKKFYQNTLFETDKTDAVNIVGGILPLSKSVVAVPLNGSLIVRAHVYLLINGESEALKYSYEATFNPLKREESNIVSNKIQGMNFSLSMFVEWG